MEKISILNVSSDAALLATRSALLTKAGYRVVSTGNWNEFEEACHTQRFDLVILGQGIPPSIKTDMAEVALRELPDTKLAELYLFSPVLTNGKYSYRVSAQLEPEEFLTFVHDVMHNSRVMR